MTYCPISYEPLAHDERYSKEGLRLLSPALQQLEVLAYSAEEQRAQAIARAGKMSIQGVQDKLSAQLKIKEQQFVIVDQFGHYILKPQSLYYPELPENEALTMTLAQAVDIDVPVHGLLYCKDGSMTYFIKRFDRIGHGNKLALEDFAQLTFASRETKYKSSMEKVAKVILQFCTFPKIECAKLFRLMLFNFLIGNEDMHLKNFSLITREQIVQLSPAYDLLNTTLPQLHADEEFALPLNGKKRQLTKNDLFRYFGEEILGLNQKIIQAIWQDFLEVRPQWEALIMRSFLKADFQAAYLRLIDQRYKRLAGAS